MKLTVGAVLACFVLAVALSSQPAEAAGVEKAVTKTALVGNDSGVTQLGQPPNVPPVDPGPPTTKPVKPPEPPKPPRSDKDGNPDDGNNGGGNDDKPPKPPKD